MDNVKTFSELAQEVTDGLIERRDAGATDKYYHQASSDLDKAWNLYLQAYATVKACLVDIDISRKL